MLSSNTDRLIWLKYPLVINEGLRFVRQVLKEIDGKSTIPEWKVDYLVDIPVKYGFYRRQGSKINAIGQALKIYAWKHRLFLVV